MKAKILALSIICLFAFACGEEGLEQQQPKPQAKPHAKSESLEYQLATIEKGYVQRDNVIIVRFRSLLEQLDRKFVEDKTQISDMTVGAQKILREQEGIEESLLTIMEGMNRLITTNAGLQYAEYASSYMVLRSKGQSHHDAIKGLRAILQTLGIY